MSIFPIIDPSASAAEAEPLPLFREIAWDYETNAPIFRQGKPVEVTGSDAVRVWIWKALHTTRFRHEIYTWAFGCEFENLIGQAYTDELKEAEAARYFRECLMINPYVMAVKNIDVSFADGRLTVSGSVETIYGEVDASVAI